MQLDSNYCCRRIRLSHRGRFWSLHNQWCLFQTALVIIIHHPNCHLLHFFLCIYMDFWYHITELTAAKRVSVFFHYVFDWTNTQGLDHKAQSVKKTIEWWPDDSLRMKHMIFIQWFSNLHWWLCVILSQQTIEVKVHPFLIGVPVQHKS